MSDEKIIKGLIEAISQKQTKKGEAVSFLIDHNWYNVAPWLTALKEKVVREADVTVKYHKDAKGYNQVDEIELAPIEQSINTAKPQTNGYYNRYNSTDERIRNTLIARECALKEARQFHTDSNNLDELRNNKDEVVNQIIATMYKFADAILEGIYDEKPKTTEPEATTDISFEPPEPIAGTSAEVANRILLEIKDVDEVLKKDIMKQVNTAMNIKPEAQKKAALEEILHNLKGE